MVLARKRGTAVALWLVTRRLDIELTSRRDDGTWTWRAAGARRPKGDLNDALVPETASVGDVLRVEADVHLDGLDIVTVFEPKPERPEPERLELVGRDAGALVTARLASNKSRREVAGDGDEGDRHGRKRRSDRPRTAGKDRRRADSDDRGDRGKESDDDRRARRGKGKPQEPEGGRRARRGKGKPQEPEGGRGARRGKEGKEDAKSGRDRRERSRGSAPDRDRPRRRDRSKPDRPERPAQPRPKRLKAKRVHRRAALEALPDDQRALAEEVLRGGVPGVRRAIGRMNEKARAEGLPPIKADPLIALAERIAPRLKAAEWRDRAEAARAGIDEIDLRDIRSVIVAADRAARTEETRALAESLRTGLAARVEAEHRQWLDELAATMAEGRTVRALRLSSRPPKAGSPLPSDMAERLARSAEESLGAEASQTRWATVVEAVAFSPVRTQVTPAGVPKQPQAPLLDAVRKFADRVPQIAALFGIEPEPPAPRQRRKPDPEAAAEPEKAAAPEADAVPEKAAEPEEAAAPEADAVPEKAAAPEADAEPEAGEEITRSSG